MTVIHKSPLPDVEIADVSITDYVLRKADEVSDKPAFIDGATGRIVTFAELKDQIQRFAGALSNRGFSVGSTLALVAPNIPEYAVVFHGCGVAGGTVTTVNPTYGAEEVRFQLLDASATILVTIEAAMPIALKASFECDWHCCFNSDKNCSRRIKELEPDFLGTVGRVNCCDSPPRYSTSMENHCIFWNIRSYQRQS